MSLEELTDGEGKPLLTPLSKEEGDALYNNLSEEEKRQAMYWGTLLGFFDALKSHDLFSATARLGILQSLDIPDIGYYKGLVKREAEDYSGAIEEFKTVPKGSDRYEDAMHILTDLCSKTGAYQELSQLLSSGEINLSPIEEFAAQISCIMRLAKNDDLSELERIISSRPVAAVTALGKSTREHHAFYSACQSLSNALVCSFECLDSCAKHEAQVDYPIADFEIDPDTESYAKAYNKCLFILQHASNFQRANDLVKAMTKGCNTLADVALVGKNWDDRIRICRSPYYAMQIANIVINLCKPESHPTENRERVVINLYECVLHRSPRLVQPLMDHYVGDVLKAAEAGNVSAEQYLAFVYGEILAGKSDKSGVREAIEQHFNDDRQFDPTDIINRRKLAHSMSQKAFSALSNAERTFQETERNHYGIRDASSLALQYFRVIEAEYNERIIKPFINLVDISKVELAFSKLPQQFQGKPNWRLDKWKRDIDVIKDVKNGNRESLECGTMRALLVHIHDYYDKCGHELHNTLIQILSTTGTQAFLSGKMMDIIGKNNLDHYRTPGAHIGYVSYSNACKARDFVFAALPEIVTWVK